MLSTLCYVLGCDSRVVLSARHKAFGLVSCCPSHDPIRHGYAVDLLAGPTPVERRPVLAAPAPPASGGSKVPRRPITPDLPPAPEAIPVPRRPQPVNADLF